MQAAKILLRVVTVPAVVSQSEMSASRLRQSIFPNIPPYLTFIPPEESYQEGAECPEELIIHYTVAQWTSLTVRDTIERFGARIVEVSGGRAKYNRQR